MSLEPFEGCPEYIFLSTNEIRLAVTLCYGPRVIGLFHHSSDVNLFKTYPQELANPTEGAFNLFGGHRLWASPEIPGFTDEADNDKVTYSQDGEWHIFEASVGVSQLKKVIAIRLHENQVSVQHTLTNVGAQTVKIAPWALSVMNEGGVGLTPQEDFKSHTEQLLPSRPLALWGYTKMDDPRLRWGSKLIRFNHAQMPPCKYGAFVSSGTAGYLLGDLLFMKKFGAQAGAEYPDFGCNFETFSRQEMLEVESLGPLVSLAPGESVEHLESWAVFQTDPLPKDEDEGRAWFDRWAHLTAAP